MDQLHRKYQNLQDNLQALGSVAVAFSGGVDSTFLLRAAHDALGSQVIAVTLSANPRNWILTDSGKIPKIGVIFANMSCLKKYGRLPRDTDFPPSRKAPTRRMRAISAQG